MFAWLKREKRAAEGTTDQIMSLSRQIALGSDAGASTAAVAACLGYWSRGFAMARAEPALIDAEQFAQIGRDLFWRGQSVWRITTNGTVSLDRASNWVTGNRSYQLTIPRPEGAETVTLLAEEVLDLRINATATQPWRGVSPLVDAGLSVRTIQRLEQMLCNAVSDGSGARILPLPAGFTDEQQDALRAKLEANSGVTLVRSAADMRANQGLSGREWATVDLTPDARKLELAENLQEGSERLAAACGIPPVLLSASPAAAAIREGMRQFWLTTLEPLARSLVPELDRKLGVASIDVADIGRADIAGRARAVGVLVNAGMTLDEARKVAGI